MNRAITENISQQAAALARNNLAEGTYGRQGERLDFSYYDTAFIDPAVMEHILFVNPVGSVVAGVQKNRAMTNISKQGIPQGHQFFVKAIKVFYTARRIIKYVADPAQDPEAYLRDLYILFSDTVLNVTIEGKATIGEWPINELMGNPLNACIVPTAEANGKPIHVNEFASFCGIFPLNIPIVLASLTDYRIVLHHYTAPTDELDTDWLKISLNGRLKRLG